MSLHVQRQMIGSAERSLAQVATERFLAGVLPVVPRELVGSREFPRAAVPRALIGFLAGVCTFVRFEVRALRVDLVAPGDVASVHLPSSNRRVRDGRRRLADDYVVVIVDADWHVFRER